MEVTFKNQRLRSLCNDSKKAKKKLGDRCARKLRTRLDDLRDARCLEDMRFLAGRCHELQGDLDGYLALDLHDGMRLIFRPEQEPPPTKDDGGLDWQAVTEIRIVEIKDYHNG